MWDGIAVVAFTVLFFSVLSIFMAEHMWSRVTAAVISVVALATFVTALIFGYQANAVKVAEKTKTCADASLIWVADREVCVNDQGWVMNPR